MHQYKDNIKKNIERLITAANNSIENVSLDRKTTKVENKNRKKNNYGYFKQKTRRQMLLQKGNPKEKMNIF